MVLKMLYKLSFLVQNNFYMNTQINLISISITIICSTNLTTYYILYLYLYIYKFIPISFPSLNSIYELQQSKKNTAFYLNTLASLILVNKL